MNQILSVFVEHMTAVSVAMKNKMDLALGGEYCYYFTIGHFKLDNSTNSEHFFTLLPGNSCHWFYNSDFTVCDPIGCVSGLGH